VHFTLSRLPTYILVSTFLPSFMLIVVGYATLFLNASLEQERLTVSLTTMLVLYTLFSNISDLLPKTSYIKMVDIWFLSCIFLIFCIIVFHVTVKNFNRENIVFSISKDKSHFNLDRFDINFLFKLIFPIFTLMLLILFWSIMIFQIYM
ncbi:unnamed protein product, partial [Meganyctiphanes norvegica]